MKRARLLLLLLPALGLALPVGVWAGLRLGLFTPLFNLVLDRQLEGVTPLRLRFGSLRSDLFSFIEADELVLLAPLKGAKVPLLTLASLRLEGDGLAAARSRLDWRDALRLARVRGLNLFVLRDREGAWNWSAAARNGAKRPAPSPGAAAKKPAFRGDVFALMLATRLELDDSQVVFNDETRGFHSTVDRIQGSLDARALPLLAFSLSGRTEGQERENLSLAGEYEHREGALFARLDLGGVPLESYVNYFLPVEGLRFLGGKASLSFRLTGERGQEVQAAGRADVADGRLSIPGVSEPLSSLHGRILVDKESVRFPNVRAHFLDSDWAAGGRLYDLKHPRFDVALSNPAFELAALSRQVVGVGLLQLSGSAAVGVSLTGAAASPLVSGWIQSSSIRIHGLDLQAVDAGVELQGARLEVPAIRGRLWDGTVSGRTAITLPVGGRQGTLEAQARLEGAKLEEFRYGGRRLLPLSGTAALDFRARGRLDQPTLEVEAAVADGRLAGWRLGQVDFKASHGAEGTSAGLRAMDGRVRGSFGLGTGTAKAYRDTQLSFDAVDLNALAKAVAESPEAELLTARIREAAAYVQLRLSGMMDATFGLEGLVAQPRVLVDLPRLEGRLRLSQGLLAMRGKAEALDLTLRGRLAVDAERLYLGRVGTPLLVGAAYKGHGLQVSALGQYPLPTFKGRQGGAGDLSVGAEGDLRLLDVFELFSGSEGTLRAALKAGGYFDLPTLQGLLEVDGFGAGFQRYTGRVSRGRLRALAQGRVIEVEELSLQAGGVLRARGQLEFSAGTVPSGLLEVRTDDQGFRVENWEEMGQGSVVLQPFSVRFHGGDAGGVDLAGRVKLQNAVVTYEGRTSVQGRRPEASGPSRPLNLDLAVALGTNVWYENHHRKEVEVSEGLTGVLGSAYESAMETLLRPDMYFRLKPTDSDFVLRGAVPKVSLSGELGIDRGSIRMMENEFAFKADGKPPRILFREDHADMSAKAVARMRYMRENALGRPMQRAVTVALDVNPMSPEEREHSGQAQAFLNYKLDFSSEPELVQGNPAKQREAILNLMVLGDPLTDEQGGMLEGGTGRPDSGQLGVNQLNRLLEGELRKQVAKISKKGLKLMGASLVDVFRLVPRWKYGGQSQASVGRVSAADASKQAQENSLYFSDVTMELGKSVFENFYASVQVVAFGENSAQLQAAATSNPNRVARNYGARASVEYQIGASRALEVYYGYSLDDNLEPLPFDQDKLYQAHNVGVRLRNTLATDNYGRKEARRRRYREALR